MSDRRLAALVLSVLLLRGGPPALAQATAATDAKAPPTTAPASQPAGTPALNYSGGWWSRPALTGDWGGARNWLSERGVRLDAQVVQYLQGNAYGGRSTHSALGYSGTVDYALNFDSQKMGLWPGGFARIRAETKFGESINGDVGAISAPNFNALLPVPGNAGITTLTEYWVMQFVSEKLGFIVGQVDLTGLPGQNRFASDRYAHFLNTSFWQNPVALALAPYSTMTAGALYSPTKWFSGATLVYDAYGTAKQSGFAEAFHAPQAASVLQSFSFNIKPLDLPGTQRLNFAFSKRTRINFDRLGPVEGWGGNDGPSGTTVRTALADALTAAQQSNGWCFWYDFDQYLYVEPEDPNQGWGVFGRFGWSPGEINPVSSFYSIGVGGRGLVPQRDRDRFGLGYYMVNMSDNLPDFLKANAEQGIELFYNIEITPWLHITPDLQCIIHPGGSTGAGAREPAFVYGVRMQMNF